jgi:hypothetical protein
MSCCDPGCGTALTYLQTIVVFVCAVLVCSCILQGVPSAPLCMYIRLGLDLVCPRPALWLWKFVGMRSTHFCVLNFECACVCIL